MIYSLLLFSTLACITCASQSTCSGSQCDVNTDNCLYGVALVQGKLVCRKGPGEKCGGEQRSLGVCGDGMTCNSCGRCRGCSIDALRQGIVECSTSPCDDHQLSTSNDTSSKEIKE